MNRSLLKIKNIIKSTKLGSRLRFLYQKRGYTRENAEAALRKFGLDTIDNKANVIDDMLHEAQKHTINFDEYLMYHFYDMPEDIRRTYVSDMERIAYCERMNSFRNMIIFDDKGMTYSKFKEYYGRELIEIFGRESQTIFKTFTKKHPRFIVKPFDGACGVGIKIVDSRNENADELFKKLCKEYKSGFVAEELIIQSETVSKPHANSVNTVRITTIRYDDRVDIIHPFWRTGRGGACVDNGGSGGIICAIDKDSGIVTSAADEKGVYYETHPESGCPLVGFQLPTKQGFREEIETIMSELNL